MEARIRYIIEMVRKLNPTQEITREYKIKGTTIEKLCEYNGGGYQRVKTWLEQKLDEQGEEKKTFDSGYVREVNKIKPRYTLIPSECLERLALHLTKGSLKYSDENWKKAETEEELKTFKDSAFRHFMDWQKGKEDEDHAMGIVCNVFFYEWITKHKHESRN